MDTARRDMLRLGLAGSLAAGVGAVPALAAHHGKQGATGKAGDRKALLAPFACNVEMWWRNDPFLDRLTKAAAHGFSHIEMWNFTGKAKAHITPQQIGAHARSLGLNMTSISPGSPDFGAAENRQGFLDAVRQAIELAGAVNTPRFNMTGHKFIPGLTVQQMADNYAAALEAAIPLLEAADVDMMIEPFNPFNHPGHFINGRQPALDICRKINSPRVKIMWDLFHMQRQDGNLIIHMKEGWDQISYIQFADSPDRHQPGTGEIAYGPVFEAARELGYDLPFGAELLPRDDDGEAAAQALMALSRDFDLSVRTKREKAPA